jgi:hypothetical protein
VSAARGEQEEQQPERQEGQVRQQGRSHVASVLSGRHAEVITGQSHVAQHDREAAGKGEEGAGDPQHAETVEGRF